MDSDTLGKPAIPDYELIRPIGRGAYGDVWLARGLTGIFRAIKIVWRDRFADSGPFDREFRGLTEFAAVSLTEARHLALLHVGRNDAGGFFYYVMELADDVATGREIRPEQYAPMTLGALREKRGRLPAAECVELAIELTEGLACLHAQNLIHRDIKPSNVVLVGGKPKLVDIGLVSAAGEGLTFVGTEGYIAPEGPGTPASDIFSLGRVLYELSTGRNRRQFPSLPEDLAQMPDRKAFLALNEVILQACEPAANRRYASAEELLRDLRALASAGSVGRFRVAATRRRLAAITAAVLLIGAGAAWWVWGKPRASRAVEMALGEGSLVAQQSIAVLPFANLSPDPANAFFADGVHEDVIVNLSKIHDLKVISRTSVMAYRTGARDLRTIARDLGVAYILEGSVRRAGKKIRVTADLVDGRLDEPIWSKIYDEDITDVFAIQSELSEKIANALQTKLTSDELRLIARRPTANQEAYDLYLQARARDEELGNVAALDQFRPVVALYQQAIEKDPNFALAYAQLSMVHMKLYRFQRLDATPARLALAQGAAEKARQLAPDDPETKLALGHLDYGGTLDLKRALTEFQAAEAGMPNDDQVLLAIGLTLRRLGRWDEALDYLGRASVLNPRAVTSCISVAELLPALRRYSQAGTAAEQYLARFPNNRRLAEILVLARYEIDADRDAYLAALDALPIDPNDPSRLVDAYLTAAMRGDWVAADRALSDPRLKELSDASEVVSDSVFLARARVAFIQGEPAVARRYAEQALAAYRARSWIPQQEPWVAMKMAEAEAYLGHAEEASREAEAAWAKVVAGGDAVDRLKIQPALGRIYLILNRREDALSVLGRMMNEPCIAGPEEVRHDPFWSRLTDDPRFEETLRSAKEL